MGSIIEYSKSSVVDSQIGKVEIDLDGSAISGVRMDASKAYAGIPALLQKVSQNSFYAHF